MALMNAQTNLRWVCGSTVPADAPTAEHPRLCLGYSLRKGRAQRRCFGQSPTGRRESLLRNYHIFSMTSTFILKNSLKCRATVVAVLTQKNTWF